MQPTTNSSIYYLFFPSSLPQIIIFHLDFYNYFFTGLSILPSPISKTLPIVYSQHRRQSCLFKIQAGSHPSFTLTSVIFPHLTQSKSQTCSSGLPGSQWADSPASSFMSPFKSPLFILILDTLQSLMFLSQLRIFSPWDILLCYFLCQWFFPYI